MFTQKPINSVSDCKLNVIYDRDIIDLETDCVGFEWNPELTNGKCKLALNRFKTSFKELFLENIKNDLIESSENNKEVYLKATHPLTWKNFIPGAGASLFRRDRNECQTVTINENAIWKIALEEYLFDKYNNTCKTECENDCPWADDLKNDPPDHNCKRTIGGETIKYWSESENKCFKFKRCTHNTTKDN